jgi:ribosome biogenesis protein SSF1/2
MISRKHFDRPPLVVLNNFNSEDPHLKLTSVVLQNMFPVINVSSIVLRSRLRVVLFDYDKETDTVEMRHYMICLVPTGLSKTVKQLVWKKDINMGKLDAVEYLLRHSKGSESDLEDTPENKVTLPVDIGVTVKKHETRAIRLLEIGPRMTFRLLKIEEGFCEGFLVYHLYIKKSLEERKQAYQKLLQRKKEKEGRRLEQEKNVKKKQNTKEKTVKTDDAEADDEADAIDDSEYYRQQVGEEPEPELFSRKSKSGKPDTKKDYQPWWKNKKGPEKSNTDQPKKDTKKNWKRKRENEVESKKPKKIKK